MHTQFYVDWVDTIASKEDSYRKKQMEQLEIWYARFPPGKKPVCTSAREECLHVRNGDYSRADNVPRANSRRSAPWRILTKKMKVLVLDWRLTAMVLVVRVVLVNE